MEIFLENYFQYAQTMSSVLVSKKLLECKLDRKIRGGSCITLQSDVPIQLYVKI